MSEKKQLTKTQESEMIKGLKVAKNDLQLALGTMRKNEWNKFQSTYIQGYMDALGVAPSPTVYVAIIRQIDLTVERKEVVENPNQLKIK